MIDIKQRINAEERAILVGVIQKSQQEQEVMENLDELAFLAETAGAIEMNGRLASVNGNQSQTAQNASPENPWKPMNQRA